MTDKKRVELIATIKELRRIREDYRGDPQSPAYHALSNAIEWLSDELPEFSSEHGRR
jgi:hypothetical protein